MNQIIQAYISRYLPQDIFYVPFVCLSGVNVRMMFDLGYDK